uniref:DNA 3'-5' helicase n=1 Tax=Romanomermis culicivorax TaxID=13658 RepID=A0A915J065_ROMCU
MLRPDYLKLGDLRERFKNVVWMALTATATKKVVGEICQYLKLRSPKTFKISAFRKNLFYDVQFKELLSESYENHLASYLKDRLQDDDSGIIYCRTKDGCVDLAAKLSGFRIKAAPYHAGLPPKQRSEIQQKWMNGEVTVVVATISFGMGVDKSNVRVVVHWSLPPSICAYYQESGRAGRDGREAYCRIYYSKIERNTVGYLLTQDFSKYKDRKDLTPEKQKAMISASQDAFEQLVNMFEKATCRHAAIAAYFDDEKPNCSKMCDYCLEPKSCALSIKLFEAQCIAQRTKIFSSADNDVLELYGGGRSGYDSKYNENDDGSYVAEKAAAQEKIDRAKLISEEFKKRRLASSQKNVQYDKAAIEERKKLESLSRLIDVSSTKVEKLSLQTRESSLAKLCDAIKENVSKCESNICDDEIVKLAASLEYSLFLAARSLVSYINSLTRAVKDIQCSTAHKRQFNRFAPANSVNSKNASYEESTDDIMSPIQTNSSPTSTFFESSRSSERLATNLPIAGFCKASALPVENQRMKESQNLSSVESPPTNSPSSVSPNCSDLSSANKRKITASDYYATKKKCATSTANTNGDSYVLTEESLRMNDDSSMSEMYTKSKWKLIPFDGLRSKTEKNVYQSERLVQIEQCVKFA